MNHAHMSYKIRPGILYRRITDAHFLIATGESREVCPVIRQISGSAAYYWKLLEQGMDICQMLQIVQRDYDLDAESLRPGLERFLTQLAEYGYIIRPDTQ